jgi:hypothetical protein
MKYSSPAIHLRGSGQIPLRDGEGLKEETRPIDKDIVKPMGQGYTVETLPVQVEG